MFLYRFCDISFGKYVQLKRKAAELDEKETTTVVMPAQLEQKYVMVPEDVRDSYLVHMIKLLLEEKLDATAQIIVFSRTCKSVQVLGTLLQKIGRGRVLHSIWNRNSVLPHSNSSGILSKNLDRKTMRRKLKNFNFRNFRFSSKFFFKSVERVF